MKKTLQSIVQIAFLILFIFLFVSGKIQLWMGLFLVGIITSFIFGRIYCGFVCSINTAMNGITWVKKKLRIKNLRIPRFLTSPWVRYATLGLFAALFIFIMVTGKKLPVLPALFLIGVLLTFLFPEELWHRYLCPYGTILSLSSLKTKHTMNIDANQCNNCGVCRRVCPTKAIEKKEDYHKIIRNECIVCMECERSCRRNAISYRGKDENDGNCNQNIKLSS